MPDPGSPAPDPGTTPNGVAGSNQAGHGIELGGAAIAVVLTAAWTWWAWKEGAYFAVVLLPGTILLCIVGAVLVGLAPWRLDLRLSRPTGAALAALVSLAFWALLSALWSPVPDVAVADAHRVLVYALAFALGLWLCSLSGRRLELSLAPLAAAAAVVGAATIAMLSTGTTPRDLLEGDGTLDYPLGYRNATAAFFAIALFPAVGLAAERGLDWRLRGLALATATTCVNLLILAQSRASAPALVVAAAIFVLLAPVRARALAWLALALLPALGFVGPGLELYTSVGDGRLSAAVGEMHAAGVAAALTALAALILGAVCARFGSRLPGPGTETPRANRAILASLALLAVAGAAVFVARVGDPVSWIDQQLEEFRGGEQDLSEQSSRFGFNFGTGRSDLWRVALESAAEDPLIGTGAGGYEYRHTLERDKPRVDVLDAHSVELELLSELGVPGLLLFLAALIGAVWGIVRSRRRGPAASALSAVALASGSYWLIHASVDWFWAYPVVTAPALALAGSACAPGALATAPRRLGALRPVLIAGLALLAASTVPPFLSERYVNGAYAGWRKDLDRAYDDLARARSLNRLSDAPLLAEGAIAREVGDRERAIAAFTAAADKRPEQWAAHYLLAELQAESDPRRARERIRIALALNPLGPAVRDLAESLGVDPDAPDAKR